MNRFMVSTTDNIASMTSQQRYLPFGQVRTDVASPNSQSLITDYGYTGQRNLDEGIGLMDYRARFYSPVLNRFIQPDTIVPGMYTPQMLNRFSYVGNNPVNYTDPSGHVCVNKQGGNDEFATAGNCGGAEDPHNDGSLLGSSSGYTSSSGNTQYHDKEDENTYQGGYVGGASPASVYQWQDFSTPNDVSSPLESFADLANIVEMYAPNGNPTLQVFLTYITSQNNNVNQISITIINNGESSATLLSIRLSEEALPSFNSCTINSTCLFRPIYSVDIDPGELETLTICQNCLDNRSTIYSYPFNDNQNNYIEIFMVLSMPIDMGSEGVKKIGNPFIYTIPPR